MENKMNDLVNREQVLEICRCFPIGTYRNEPVYDGSLSAAMDRISDLPAIIPEPRWIPVTERLPDVTSNKSGYEQVYVIATDGKHVRPMIYERACPRGKTVYRWKWIWDRIYDGNPITHWMSLPKPPKGGSRYDRNYPV